MEPGRVLDRAAARAALAERAAKPFIVIATVVALTFGLAAFRRAEPMERLDHAFLDILVCAFASDEASRDTVVVDIDDVSLSAVGQWPWPRYRIAMLIERLAAHRPSAIGLDVLMPEPDRSSLVNIQQTFKRDFDVDVAFSGVPSGLLDNDGYLGYEIARSGVVAADYFYFDLFNRIAAPIRTGLSFDGRSDTLDLERATGVLVNAFDVARQTRTTGFVNERPDADGVLRRLPLLIRYDGTIHASLALATVMRSLGLSSASIDADANGPTVRIGDRRIPIDATGDATLRFNGDAGRYAAIPAVDVLNDKVRAEDIEGRIVFIGSSAVGLNDAHDTAVGRHFSGSKIQAVMAQDLLDDAVVRTPRWEPLAAAVACIAVGGAMAALFVAMAGIPAVVAGTSVLLIALLGSSALAFRRVGLFVSPVAPVAVVVTLFVAFFVVRFAIERRRAAAWQKKLENARQVTIESMASVAESRDPETGAHIKRTQHYVRAIAEQLRRTGLHPQTLTKDYIHLLFLSAPLHDIGKVGVPDHILLKPGRLTPDEFELMKLHADFGRKILESTGQRIEGDNYLIIAGEIAATHHEKWDGSGYPLGLAGENIPLSGRIMAVADIYDALISRRCYKDAFPHDRATALMREGGGTTFDPAVLDAFFAIETTIQDIADCYRDDAGDVPVVVHGFSERDQPRFAKPPSTGDDARGEPDGTAIVVS